MESIIEGIPTSFDRRNQRGDRYRGEIFSERPCPNYQICGDTDHYSSHSDHVDDLYPDYYSHHQNNIRTDMPPTSQPIQTWNFPDSVDSTQRQPIVQPSNASSTSDSGSNTARFMEYVPLTLLAIILILIYIFLTNIRR